MVSTKLWAKIPLIGMSMVFLAMAIVAVTAYLHAGWYSAIGYAAAGAPRKAAGSAHHGR